MFDLVLFAGTAEGHRIFSHLFRAGRPALILTATDYGRDLLLFEEDRKSFSGIEIRSGRLDKDAIVRLLREETTPQARIVDATHPYAAAATENIRTACRKENRKYVRILRKGLADSPEAACKDRGNRLIFPDLSSACAYLDQTVGNVFLTTGSRDLEVFTSIRNYRERLYARVLSLPSVVRKCSSLGFEGKHLICMQGPFSFELNLAMLRHCQASYLVTKDTGIEGGFPEKEAAAAACGCTLIVISRPSDEEGIPVDAFLAELSAEDTPEGNKREGKDRRKI
jgi:precorrin-6x reductase